MALSLQTVLDSNLCSGCGLCASLLADTGARMALTDDGFLRPHLAAPPNPAQDALIGQVCPGSQVVLPPVTETTAGIAEWGPLVATYTGHATDAALRHAASSGGVLSAILNHLLVEGRVTAVVHVGADPDVPWLNRTGESHDAADVVQRAGSRYAPSAPLAGLIQRLDAGVPFAVVGKPCDIAALRAYARHDVRVDALIPVMLAFMCGGIPSETGIRTLIRRMGTTPEQVATFRFRGDGWPGQARATTADGQAFQMSYAQSWGDVLSRHVQLRCKICADGTGMSADIVCADAWYGDSRGYPSFEEEDGRSLVLARTPKGAELLGAVEQGGRIALAPLDPRAIQAMQPAQIRRTRLTLSRITAMRILGRPATAFIGQSLWTFARHAGLAISLRSFAGTLVRVLRRRL